MKNAIIIPALILAFTSLFGQTMNAQAPTFQSFLAQFPKATLPYAICESDLQSTKALATTRLGWEYYEFLPELEHSAQYSRMPVYPEPVAVFETEQNFAVLYNIARGVSKGKSYCISVFDKKGNHLATNFVAGINTTTLTTVTIDAELRAAVQGFQINGTELQPMNSQPLDLIIPGNPDQIDWSVVSAQNNTAVAVAK